MGAPGLWDIIRCFKRECESKGWNTSAHEDWIFSDRLYHNFLWTRTIHPSTFKKIAKTSKCAIRKGVDYQVVDVTYTAWLFSEPPPDEIWGTTMIDQNLAERTAIYDLSNLHASESTCVKLNSTESGVFREFEDFLRRKFGTRFKAPNHLVTAQAQ